MEIEIKKPILYITDDFETWKNKINGMTDFVDAKLDKIFDDSQEYIEDLLEDCVEELISEKMDDRAIALSMALDDISSHSDFKIEEPTSNIYGTLKIQNPSPRDIPNIAAVQNALNNPEGGIRINSSGKAEVAVIADQYKKSLIYLKELPKDKDAINKLKESLQDGALIIIDE